MALETGTYIDNLVVTNPPGGDDKRQGDDHLRLIKSVLKNTFPTATKSFSFPRVVSTTSNTTVVAADENTTYVMNTTFTPTITLPTLDSTKYGWKIRVVKSTTDANPVFIQASGGQLINGYSRIRRSVYASVTEVEWVGLWAATRPNGGVIGEVKEYYGASLPNGHLWADGAAISGNFTELIATIGGATPNKQGRVAAARDPTGTVLDNTYITANGLFSLGGTQGFILATGNLPAITVNGSSFSWSGSWSQGGTSYGFTNPTYAFTGEDYITPLAVSGGGSPRVVSSGDGSAVAINQGTGVSLGSFFRSSSFNSIDGRVSTGSVDLSGGGGISVSMAGSVSGSISGSASVGGSSTAIGRLQPTIICNAIVVAE